MTTSQQKDEQGRMIITRSEWRAKHRDYKVTARSAQDGVPKVLQYDPQYGTCLVPVTIVPDPK